MRFWAFGFGYKAPSACCRRGHGTAAGAQRHGEERFGRGRFQLMQNASGKPTDAVVAVAPEDLRATGVRG